VIITKRQLRRIIKEALEESLFGEGAPPADLYSDYSDDPVEALEMRRQELRTKIESGGPEAMDAFEEWKNLGRELSKLKGTDMGPMYTDEDHAAAEEILSTRMGSYRGTTLPGGKRIK
jgi:hypothetical protein